MISKYFSDDRRVGKILYADACRAALRAARHEAERIPYFFKDANGILKKIITS